GLQGDYTAARLRGEEAITLWRLLGGAGAPAGPAHALARLGFAIMVYGRRAEAQALLAESLALFRAAGGAPWARWGSALALSGLGFVQAAEGDYPAARASYKE